MVIIEGIVKANKIRIDLVETMDKNRHFIMLLHSQIFGDHYACDEDDSIIKFETKNDAIGYALERRLLKR